MKTLCLFLSIFISIILTGCSSSVKNNIENTPTTEPNTMPYAIFYNNNLYLYESEYSFTQDNMSDLIVLDEIEESTTGDKLPNINNQTNINICYLPTPLFGIKSDETKIIMEVNTIYTNNVNVPYSHTYYMFSLNTTGL